MSALKHAAEQEPAGGLSMADAEGITLPHAIKVGLGLALVAAVTAVAVGTLMSLRTRRKREAMTVLWQTEEAQSAEGVSGQGAASSSS